MPNLTGYAPLDIAIGLAFVYLLFSVLCSAVQEAIAGVLDWRAATLEKGLRNLLDDGGQPGTGGAPKTVTLVPALAADGEAPGAGGAPGAAPRRAPCRLPGGLPGLHRAGRPRLQPTPGSAYRS